MEAALTELIRRLKKADKYSEFADEYSRLKTDEGRVKFVMKFIREYEITPIIKCEEKNADQSKKFRDVGNKYFTPLNPMERPMLDQSIEEYTKSIVFAPNNSIEMSSTFANRSAVLFTAGLFEDCLLDIDRALNFNYPDELKAKLFTRRARCLMALKDSSDGKLEKALEEAQKWLEKMDINHAGKSVIEETLNNSKKMACTNKKFKKWDEEKFRPNITGDMNPEFMGASSAIELKYSEKMGRHIVATRDIKVGEILVIEKGYTFILMPEKFYTHCSYCLKQTWSSIPCNYCVHVIYCNEECRDAAWKEHHDIECQVIGQLLGVEMENLGLMSLRLAVLAWKEAGSLDKLKKIIENAESVKDPRINGFTEGKFDDTKYVSIYTLPRNSDNREMIDLLGRSFNTVHIIRMLATRSNLFGEKLKNDLETLEKNEWVTFIAGLIMRHQQIIPTCGHFVTEEKISSEPDDKASTILPFCTHFNHSCDPSIRKSFFGKNVVFYAVKPVEKGEQIFDNYGPHYLLQPQFIRNLKLQKQFNFKCECTACVEDWSSYSGLLMTQDSLIYGHDEREKLKIRKIEGKAFKYMNLALRGDIENHEEIIKDLSSMMNYLLEKIYPPCETAIRMKETLQRIYFLLGNRFQSLM